MDDLDLAGLNVVVNSTGVTATAGKLEHLERAGMGAAMAAQRLGTASNHAKTYSTQVGKATQHTANLGAQLNDIGVMLAAGQNPLQLALQQGTQINQVFARLGGGTNALRALGAAAMSVISPTGLLTIGVIAGGAALIQWAFSAKGADKAAEEYKKTVKETRDALTAYKKATDEASASSDELEKKYGAVTTGLRSALAALREAGKAEAREAISLLTGVAEIGQRGDGDRKSSIASFFDVNIFLAFTDAAREHRSVARSLTAEYLKQQNTIATSQAGTREQIDALTTLLDVATKLADMDGDRTAAEQARIKAIAEALVISQQFFAVEQKNTVSLIQAYTVYGATRRQALTDAEEAGQKILTSLREEMNIQKLIATYGKDSVAVTAARTAMARKAYAEEVKSLNVSKELATELMDAWDAAEAISNSNMAKAISPAVEQAKLLAEQLGVSLAAAMSLQNLRGSKTYSGRGGDPRDFEGGGRNSDTFFGWEKPTKSKQDEYKSDLESLQESLRTERQVTEEWHKEAQAIAANRRITELLTEQEHKDLLLAINYKYSTDLMQLKLDEAEMVRSAQRSMYQDLGGLLGQFAQKSKAAAVAQIGINTYLRATEAAQNTAAAMVRALAELGPIAGPPAAAKIGAFGKIQVAAIIAGGVVQAGSALSGGSSSSGSSSGALTQDPVVTQEPIRIIVEDINPDAIYSGKQFITLVEKIQEEFDNQGINFGFK